MLAWRWLNSFVFPPWISATALSYTLLRSLSPLSNLLLFILPSTTIYCGLDSFVKISFIFIFPYLWFYVLSIEYEVSRASVCLFIALLLYYCLFEGVGSK